ncbi:MAG: hypothetical protein R3A48_06215 [Polyangiales bacterium]
MTRIHLALLGFCLAAACSNTSGDTVVGAGADAEVDAGAADVVEDVATDAGPTDVGPDLTATSIETEAPRTVRAGEVIAVRCVLRNAAGMDVPTPAGMAPTITFDAATAVRESGGSYTAVRVGDVTARCALGALSDATPAEIRIEPGAPARVTTTLDRAMIAAGETSTATCAVTDAEGNALADVTPTVSVTPSGDGVSVSGFGVRSERSGSFMVRCVVPGAQGDPATLSVSPGLPASLAITRSPDRPLYAMGEEIEVQSVVTDRFGNRVENPTLEYGVATQAMNVRPGVYSYAEEGRYTITVRVAGMTEGGAELSQSTSFTVDSSGPAISCTTPGDVTMVDHAPGAPLTIRGTLRDTSGVRALTVNGQSVTPGNDGSFSATVPSRFGMVFVDVEATDTNGLENSRTCTYLVSNRWLPETSLLTDGATLRLTQAALDDGNPVSPITSLDDVLQTVVNSSGLRTQLDTALRAANPLKNSCDQQACLPFGGPCTCIFRSRVDYDGSEINGPNATSLTLVNGGLRANVRFENVRVRLRISGTLSTSGWVTVRSVDVGVIFDVSASGGRPRVVVRPNSTTVSVGQISTDFSGLTGVIVNVVASLAQGTVRNLVSNALRDYVSSNFTSVLDGVLGGFDVSSLGASFNVPRLDGSGTVPLQFGLGLSTLSATSSRLLLGLGTRFSTMTVRATASRGVALPPAVTDAVPLTRPATVTVQPAMLNEALHALWRGGFFDANISVGSLGDVFPQGTRVRVATALPPVAQLRGDGRMGVDLGGLTASIPLPGASQPFSVTVGARASLAVTLSGNDLRFGSIMLDELHISLDSQSITGTERTALTRGVRLLVEDLLTRSLNDALPAIPIPGFAIPSSLSTYGLPAGRELGIVSPTLGNSSGLFVLSGGFGTR